MTGRVTQGPKKRFDLSTSLHALRQHSLDLGPQSSSQQKWSLIAKVADATRHLLARAFPLVPGFAMLSVITRLFSLWLDHPRPQDNGLNRSNCPYLTASLVRVH